MNELYKKEINISELYFLWIENYYDGPICGYLIYQNRLCYFAALSDINGKECFEIILVPSFEIAEVYHRHDDFTASVGVYYNCTNGNLYSYGKFDNWPKNNYEKYYKSSDRLSLLSHQELDSNQKYYLGYFFA